jgi:hypothetical protein
MKSRSALLLLLIIIGGLGISGCISGSDENLEAWNEGVDKANDLITDGNTARTQLESAWDAGQYDVAYNKGSEAIGYYEDGLEEIEDLEDIARDIDKDFLDDYVDAWHEQITAFIELTQSQQMLVRIDQFNVLFNQFFSSYYTAEDQYFDAVDYYNESNYQATLSTITLSKQKWTQMQATTQALTAVAQDLGLSYAVDYTNYMSALCGYALSSLENLRLASLEAQGGNYGQADYYIGLQNNDNAAYYNTIDSLITIEGMYPNAFPDGDEALVDVYNSYLAAFNDAQDTILELEDEKDDIVEDNDDFFE